MPLVAAPFRSWTMPLGAHIASMASARPLFQTSSKYVGTSFLLSATVAISAELLSVGSVHEADYNAFVASSNRRTRRLVKWAVRLRTVLGLAAAVMFGAVAAANQTRSTPRPLDLSGVAQFWAIADTLAADRTPTEAQWRRMFSTRAYRYLIDVNRRERVLRTFLPLAFMPSRREARERALGDGTYESRAYLAHFVEARSKRAELQAFAARLPRQHVLDRAVARAAALLPPGATETIAPPPVSFAIFEPDAFGSADDGIVVDLLFATRVDVVNLIAHEAHHYFLQAMFPVRALDRDRDDYALVHALNQLRLEGVADEIDKADILDAAADRADQQETRTRYRQLYSESAVRLAQIDALIAAVADDPSLLKTNGQRVWDLLPNGGHPQGFFMATQIERALGRAALVTAIASPFEFVRIYNRAAARLADPQRYPVFSASAMRTIDSLEHADGR